MGKPPLIDYKFAIYGFHGPDGTIRFVGKSHYAAQALAQAKLYARYKPERKLSLWINTIGPDNVRVVVLERIYDSAATFVRARLAYYRNFYGLNSPKKKPLLDTHRQGAHTRWHTNRNVIKEDCGYCVKKKVKPVDGTLEEQLAAAEKQILAAEKHLNQMRTRYGSFDLNTTNAESNLQDARSRVKLLKLLIEKEAK